MRILSLDLSSKSTGYAIGQDEKLEKHGCITASSKNTVKRIIKIRDEIKQLIIENNIDKIIAEEVRPQYNSRTNKVLMWLQAAIVIAACEVNDKIQIEFIGASSWRAALNIKQGRGVKRDQLKPRDIQYVKDKYNIVVNDDEADAICIFDSYWIKFDNQLNWE